MKYITDTTVKDVNTLIFIINVFNSDMEEYTNINLFLPLPNKIIL